MNLIRTLDLLSHSKPGRLEYRLIIIVFCFLLFGLLMSFNLGFIPRGDIKYADYLMNVMKFIILAALGFFVAIQLRSASPKFLQILSNAAMLIGLALLIATDIWGIEKNGAQRWLNILGFSFQTSEFFKFALILGLANVLQQFDPSSNLKFSRNLFIYLYWPILIAGLILIYKQPNHSAVYVIAALVITIAIFSRIRWYFILTAGFIVILIITLFIMKDPEKRNRILAFSTKSDTEQSFTLSDERFQARISSKAVQSGKLLGIGYTKSIIKYSLPAASTDFIFAIIVEELGFVTGALILIGYFLFILFSLEIVFQEKNEFLRLSGIGFVILFLINVCLHVAVNLDMVPTTGVPLPFISQGGSSLLMSLLAMGVILNIARRQDFRAN